MVLQSNSLLGERERRTEKQKFQYLNNEKSFLDEIKAFFIVFNGYH